MANSSAIDRAAIEATYATIRPHVRCTPVVEVPATEFGLGDFTLVFKLESLQHSGSFKARGATANLLLRRPGRDGVTAASGGNHGTAVAYAAQRHGAKATIFVPTICSPAKIARIRHYGARARDHRRALRRCARGLRGVRRRSTTSSPFMHSTKWPRCSVKARSVSSSTDRRGRSTW